MKVWLVALAGMLSILVIISCQKEVEWNNTDSISGNDRVYLSKMIAIDTTMPVGSDTIMRIYFEYDSKKRLIKMSDFFTHPYEHDSVYTSFFYSGNDSLPNKTVVYSNYNYLSGPARYADTLYLFYNGDFVQRDSLLSWSRTSGLLLDVAAAEYSVQGNIITKTRRYYRNLGGVYSLDFSEVLRYNSASLNGNLVTENRLSGMGEFVFVEASYDNNPNPFSKEYKIKYPDFGGGNNRYGDSWLFQKNNPISVRFQDTGYPVVNMSYTYQYRTDGLPVVVLCRDDSGLTPYSKILYYYSVL